MPTLASSNRTQLAYKLEGVYPNNFGVLQGGNGTLLNLTGESLSFDIKSEVSKTIRPDRQQADLNLVGASAAGGVQFEHYYRDLDGLMEGLLQSSYTAYGTNGVSAAIATLNLAAGTVTAGAAPAGNDALTNLNKGQWFSIIPPAGATAAVKAYFAGRAFRVSPTVAPTSTVITLDAATPINTALAGASLSNAQIASSRMVNGTAMRSYSLEAGHQDVGQYRQYLGMVPSKYDLKIAAGALVTGSMEFMGREMLLAQSSGMGTPAPASAFTPANAVRGVVDIYEGGAALSVTTYLKSADISIDNSLRAQEAVGVFGNAGVGSGTLKVSGKLEMYFTNQAHYEKFVNNTASSLSIPVLDPSGNGYVYHLPRIKYTAAKVNAGGLDQDLMLSLDFTALVDTTATSGTFGSSVAIYRVGAAA